MKQRSLNARSESQPGHTLGERGMSERRGRRGLLARCLRTGDLFRCEIVGGARSMRAEKTSRATP